MELKQALFAELEAKNKKKGKKAEPLNFDDVLI
jgi:hypothetical protein